ncbi:hypothetical protein [Chlamydia vaughanii]|uniref:hypothetical protein n=1 Tax=Chlamydia vaughanii TaxID=3112552 RepID=UPI0032B21E5A
MSIALLSCLLASMSQFPEEEPQDAQASTTTSLSQEIKKPSSSAKETLKRVASICLIIFALSLPIVMLVVSALGLLGPLSTYVLVTSAVGVGFQVLLGIALIGCLVRRKYLKAKKKGNEETGALVTEGARRQDTSRRNSLEISSKVSTDSRVRTEGQVYTDSESDTDDQSEQDS